MRAPHDGFGVERPHAYEYDVRGGELLFRGFFGEGHPGAELLFERLAQGDIVVTLDCRRTCPARDFVEKLACREYLRSGFERQEPVVPEQYDAFGARSVSGGFVFGKFRQQFGFVLFVALAVVQPEPDAGGDQRTDHRVDVGFGDFALRQQLLCRDILFPAARHLDVLT